jgi:hypothetical protein
MVLNANGTILTPYYNQTNNAGDYESGAIASFDMSGNLQRDWGKNQRLRTAESNLSTIYTDYSVGLPTKINELVNHLNSLTMYSTNLANLTPLSLNITNPPVPTPGPSPVPMPTPIATPIPTPTATPTPLTQIPFLLDTRNGSYAYGPTSIGNYSMNQSLGTIAVSNGSLSINGNIIPQGVQVWTVGTSGSYTLVGAGASGSTYYIIGSTPGYGIVASTTYNFTAGQTVCMMIGQQPLNAVNGGAQGGGGGTFITIYAGTGSFSNSSQHTLLLACGGGGAIGGWNAVTNASQLSPGMNAVTTTSGTLATGYGSITVATNGGGGGGGNGGNGSSPAVSQTSSSSNYGSSSGGGGFIGNGGDGCSGTTTGGFSFLNGGVGGVKNHLASVECFLGLERQFETKMFQSQNTPIRQRNIHLQILVEFIQRFFAELHV